MAVAYETTSPLSTRVEGTGQQQNGNHLLDCPTDDVQDGLFVKPDFGGVCLIDSGERRFPKSQLYIHPSLSRSGLKRAVMISVRYRMN